MFFSSSFHILHIFPLYFCFSLQAIGTHLYLHVLKIVMNYEEFFHSKEPCFNILLFLHLTMKFRRLGFLKFLWHMVSLSPLVVMIPHGSRTRVLSMGTSSSLQITQWHTSPYYVYAFQYAPFFGHTSICSIIPLFLVSLCWWTTSDPVDSCQIMFLLSL